MIKIFDKFNPSHSMAGRLTMRVTFVIFIVFAIISALIFSIVWLLGFGIASLECKNMLGELNGKTDNVYTSVEVAIANNKAEVEENIDNPDQMYGIVQHFVQLNPNIVGAAIAFEPNFYAQKGMYYSPYAYRNGNEYNTKQLGNEGYHYYDMEWYKKSKETGQSNWSEPYFDRGGGEMLMTTYSQPFYDKQGNFCGVLTADVSLDWLTNMVERITSINAKKEIAFINMKSDIYGFIITQKGTYIVHPEKERIMRDNIFSLVKRTRSTKDDAIPVMMTAGQKGMSFYYDDDNDDRYLLFYAPIQHTGWSSAIVVPVQDIFEVGNIVGLVVLICLMVGLVIVSIICYIAIKHTTQPLTRFAHSADEIAQGKFTEPLPDIRTKDEMLKLRRSFETMQLSLVDQINQTRKINETKGRIESELQIARGIQMAMLPKKFPSFPERKDVELYAQLTPAKEVGGDLYDFFIRDEKLFFCIGDVSGKGVPSSLVMVVVRVLFRTLTTHESNPSKIVAHINEALTDENNSNMFVTLFVGVLDLPTGRLRYCNAGHCAPILIGSGIGQLPVIANIPAGIDHNYKYEGQETQIDPDTTIFLYTDGLTEAEDAEHNLFMEHRVMTVVTRCHEQHQNQPQTIIDEMERTVKSFVGSAERSDDLTMMAIQYHKEQHDVKLQRSLSLPNDIETVPQLNAFIDGVAEEIGLDTTLTMSLNLAIEEAVVNVMNYAYPSGKQGDVNVDVTADSEWLTFVISDKGMPFDPTAKEEADTTLSVEERPIGGLGIFLVRQLMDSINYERTDGKNVLTLKKKLK